MAQIQTAPAPSEADQLAEELVTLARRAHGALKAGNLADLAAKAAGLADTLEARGFGKVLLKALRSQHEDRLVAARRQQAGINSVALAAISVSGQMREELDEGTFRAVVELIERVSVADLVKVEVQKELAFLMGAVIRELGPAGAQMREELKKFLAQIREVETHIENAPSWAFKDWESLTDSPRLPLVVRLAKARNLAGWLSRNRKRLEREAVASQQRLAAAHTVAAKRRHRPKRQKLPAKPRRSQEEILAALPLGKPNPQGFGQTERGKVVPGAGTPKSKRKK